MGWQPGTAKVIARQTGKYWFGMRKVNSQRGKGLSQAFDYVLDVAPADGSPVFRTVVKGPWSSRELRFRPPTIGTKISVECDVSRKKAKLDKNDPRMYPPRESLGEQMKANDERFAAAAKGQPRHDKPKAPKPKGFRPAGGPDAPASADAPRDEAGGL